MDIFMAFLAGVFVNWYAVSILFVIGILFDRNEHGIMAVISIAAIIGIVSMLLGVSISPSFAAVLFGVYVVVGVLWSFWRYSRHVSAAVADIKAMGYTDGTRERMIRDMQPKAMVGTIIEWICTWPLSFISNMVGDFIDGLRILVTRVFNRVYEQIFASAIRELDGLAKTAE